MLPNISPGKFSFPSASAYFSNNSRCRSTLPGPSRLSPTTKYNANPIYGCKQTIPSQAIEAPGVNCRRKTVGTIPNRISQPTDVYKINQLMNRRS
jgi:hypothetical protein